MNGRSQQSDGDLVRYLGRSIKVWVNDIVWWEADADCLLDILDKILGRLEDADLFAAAYKCLFFKARSRGVERCTKRGRCLTTESV